MNEIITYNNCPACSGNNIAPALEAIDHTVSHEKFEIWECRDCTLRFTQNVPSASNIGKYYKSDEYISHSDTKKGIINRLYHIVRFFTLRSKCKLVEKISGKKNGSLLDIGAGTGAFANAMAQRGWQVTGLEPDDTARHNAKMEYAIQLQSPDQLYHFPEKSFDIITMWHVLEHVHELPAYIETFKKILQDDGVLMIAVPNYTSDDAKRYGSSWAAYDVPRHLYHFSPLSMDKLMEQNGFRITSLRPMWFDSYYVCMLSEKYKNGKPGLFKAFCNGRRSNKIAAKDNSRCSSVIYVIRKG